MVQPLVTQLWFARSELIRCLEGVSPEDAVHRFEPMNCISWIVGHLASQEHYLWVELGQGLDIASNLHELVGFRRPASTPPWEEMWTQWRSITKMADNYLVTITPETLRTYLLRQGDPIPEDVGTSLLRNIFHYWFHIGEAHAIRQMLGHEKLPQFVGNMAKVHH
ncbi:MAG: DinB family protein [Anaerolineales bacterium]|jgi:hypothetical protein